MRISKANQKLQQQLAAQRQVQHFGLRKLSVGVASVLLSTSLYFGAASVAHAATGTPSGEAASVDTETVTSGVANQESTATLTQSTANEAPVDDEVTSAADQTPPANATTPSSAVDLKDATPSVNRRVRVVAPKASVTPTAASIEGADSNKVAATSQYDVDDIYNYYHDKGSNVSKERIQKLVDYKNNLASVTAILDLNQTGYGSYWVDQALEKQLAKATTLTDTFVDNLISRNGGQLVEDTNQKIDAQLVKLAALQKQYPNNPDVKKAIDELTNAKTMVTPETIFDANKMETVVKALNKYVSKNAYNELEKRVQENPDGNNQALDEAKKNAKTAIENLTNLNQAQKEAALAQVEAATTVDEAKNYADTATTLDHAMKDLADTATNADTTSGNYTNADADKQAALQKAIADAQTLAQSTTEAADADKVEAAKRAIEAAQAALNGNDKLAQAKTKAKETINGLKNLNQAQKEAVLAQVEAATTVDAANDYANTLTTLDNKMGDLKQAVDQAKKVKDTGNYTNADTAAQRALNDALTNGEDITTSGNTAAGDVEAAIKALTEAMNGLNGDEKLADAKTKAQEAIENLANLTVDQKQAAQEAIEAATDPTAVSAAQGTATTLDNKMGALKQAVDQAKQAQGTGNYTNADTAAQQALNDALTSGEGITANGNTPVDTVDAAIKTLTEAMNKLNGDTKLAATKTAVKEVINGLTNLNQAQKEAALAQVKAATTVDEAKNYATTAITLDDTMGALQKAVTDGNNGKVADPKYYNADATTRAAYDKALSNAQAVLDDANATQAQIDQAKADLAQAAEALTGKATDKSALQATYNQANVAAKTTAYTNVNDTIKRAYEKALGEAQAVLADANATQVQVDLAKAALDEIMALLKGASGDATVAKNSSDQSDQNGLSKAATAIDGENTTSTTSSASKQNQLPQTGAADDASLVAAGLGLTLASMLLGLGAKLKRRQN